MGTRSETSPGNGHGDHLQIVPSVGHDDTAEHVVRDMVREDRASHPDRRDGLHTGTTASADAVESLRRSLRDLKHDVRMLKVGMDKQSQLLEYIATFLERENGQRQRG